MGQREAAQRVTAEKAQARVKALACAQGTPSP